MDAVSPVACQGKILTYQQKKLSEIFKLYIFYMNTD